MFNNRQLLKLVIISFILVALLSNSGGEEKLNTSHSKGFWVKKNLECGGDRLVLKSHVSYRSQMLLVCVASLRLQPFKPVRLRNEKIIR